MSAEMPSVDDGLRVLERDLADRLRHEIAVYNRPAFMLVGDDARLVLEALKEVGRHRLESYARLLRSVTSDPRLARDVLERGRYGDDEEGDDAAAT